MAGTKREPQGVTDWIKTALIVLSLLGWAFNASRGVATKKDLEAVESRAAAARQEMAARIARLEEPYFKRGGDDTR